MRDEPVLGVFMGDGNQRAHLEARAAAEGLAHRVRFLGWRPNEQMPRYLNLADILLVSLRRDDSLATTVPAKLQSSLATGRPVLAALGGEVARIVEESRGGLVVEQEDARALADGIRRLLAMTTAEREAMGECGRAYAREHFDRETLVDRLDGWLHEIVRTRR